jgi:clan AA aspartic protease (TIGR02281 family)
MLLRIRNGFLCFLLFTLPAKTIIAQSIIEQAWALERAGKNEEAFQAFQKAVKQFPDTARVWKGRADVGFILYGDTDAAIRDYDKAIALKPTAVYAYEQRGLLKHWKKDYYGAMGDFSKAIELKPDFDKAYSNRAYSKFKLNQYQDAIQDFNSAIGLNPNYAAAYLGRGDAERELGQYDAAMDDFNKCVGLNPRFKKAYDNRVNDDPNFNGMDKVSVVKMQKVSGNYRIAVQIDGIDADFFLDTGASSVCISDAEADNLRKAGKLTDNDILGDSKSSFANGSISTSTVIVLRTVRIGNKILYNVPAIINHGSNVPMLMGETALSKFGKITIDYANNEITFQ